MENLILKSLNQLPYDIAVVFYNMFKDKYKFTNKEWYKRDGDGNWNTVQGSEIRLLISTKLHDEYIILLRKYAPDNYERSRCFEIFQRLAEVSNKLKIPKHKKDIEHELKDLFSQTIS